MCKIKEDFNYIPLCLSSVLYGHRARLDRISSTSHVHARRRRIRCLSSFCTPAITRHAALQCPTCMHGLPLPVCFLTTSITLSLHRRRPRKLLILRPGLPKHHLGALTLAFPLAPQISPFQRDTLRLSKRQELYERQIIRVSPYTQAPCSKPQRRRSRRRSMRRRARVRRLEGRELPDAAGQGA